jgi:hypothetical protein
MYHPSSTRWDAVEFWGDGPTYRALGLLVFGTLFHRSRSVLHLREPRRAESAAAPIERLVVDGTVRGPSVSELVLHPVAYGYWPSTSRTRHPFHEPCLPRRQRPQLIWSNDENMLSADPGSEARPVVHGFGAAEGAARIAALFLDFGLPGSERHEASLEGPAGNHSVTDLSAEARLWLGYD